MTVDYIFDFLSGLLEGIISSDYLLIMSMLIPCLDIDMINRKSDPIMPSNRLDKKSKI